ncbi:MAG: hypothetical protein F6K19_27250 [Cyanothece sp. SIO1E1]|nr:hypothetical protein [Cyanothece sp. SIO1E1]
MTLTTESITYDKDHFDWDKLDKKACVFDIPIVLKVPIILKPVVVGKEPECVEKNGYGKK